MSRLLIWIAIGTSLATFLIANVTVAEDATPVAAVVPDPAACLVQPRPADEVLALVPTPSTGPLNPAADLNQILPTAAANIFATVAAGTAFFTPPAGTPADPAITTAVEATLREFYACYNTGDPARWTALLTDDALRRFPEGQAGLMVVTNLFPVQFSPLAPERRVGYAAIRDVQRLPDGHIGALVETIRPSDQGGGIRDDYWLLQQQNDHLLIDGVILGAGGQPLFGNTAPATPTP
jgi:hypothetical protein